MGDSTVSVPDPNVERVRQESDKTNSLLSLAIPRIKDYLEGRKDFFVRSYEEALAYPPIKTVLEGVGVPFRLAGEALVGQTDQPGSLTQTFQKLREAEGPGPTPLHDIGRLLDAYRQADPPDEALGNVMALLGLAPIGGFGGAKVLKAVTEETPAARTATERIAVRRPVTIETRAGPVNLGGVGPEITVATEARDVTAGAVTTKKVVGEVAPVIGPTEGIGQVVRPRSFFADATEEMKRTVLSEAEKTGGYNQSQMQALDSFLQSLPTEPVLKQVRTIFESGQTSGERFLREIGGERFVEKVGLREGEPVIERAKVVGPREEGTNLLVGGKMMRVGPPQIVSPTGEQVLGEMRKAVGAQTVSSFARALQTAESLLEENKRWFSGGISKVWRVLPEDWRPFANQKLVPAARFALSERQMLQDVGGMESVVFGARGGEEFSRIFPTLDTFPTPLAQRAKDFVGLVNDAKIPDIEKMLWRVAHYVEHPRYYIKSSLDTRSTIDSAVNNFNDLLTFLRYTTKEKAEPLARYWARLWDEKSIRSAIEEDVFTDTGVLSDKAFGYVSKFLRPFEQERAFVKVEDAFRAGIRWNQSINTWGDYFAIRASHVWNSLADSILESRAAELPESQKRLMRDILHGEGFSMLGKGPIPGVIDLVRQTMLSTGDIAVIGVQQAPLLSEMATRNPLRTVSTLGNSLHFLVGSNKSWAEHLAMEMDVLHRMAAARVAMPISVLERPEGGKLWFEKPLFRDAPGVLKRVPFLGWNPIQILNDRQFGRLLFYSVKEMFKAQSDIIYTTSKVSRAQADMLAAQITNKFAGALPNLFEGPHQRQLEKTFLLTPRFTKSLLSVPFSLVKPGPEGRMARSFLIRLALVDVAVTEAITYAQTGGHISLDPDDADFMRGKLADGRRFTLAPRFRDLFLTLKHPERVPRFAQSRLHAVWGEGLAQLQDKDYLGQVITEKSGLAGAPERLWHAGTNLLAPISGGQYYDEWRKGVREPTGVALQALGFTNYIRPKVEQTVRAAYAQAMVEQGLVPPELADKQRLSLQPMLRISMDGKTEALTRAQKEGVVQDVVRRTGLEEEMVRRYGGAEPGKTPAEQESVQREHVTEFYREEGRIEDKWRAKMLSLEDSGKSYVDIGMEIQDANKLRRQRHLDNRTQYLDDVAAQEKRVLDAVKEGKRPGKNELETVYDEIRANTFEAATVPDEGGKVEVDWGAFEKGKEKMVERFGKGLVEEALSTSLKSAPPLYQEYVREAILGLKLYWEVPEKVLKPDQAREYREYLDTKSVTTRRLMEQANPSLFFYDKMVSFERKKLRVYDQGIDSLLVKWKGYAPMNTINRLQAR